MNAAPIDSAGGRRGPTDQTAAADAAAGDDALLEHPDGWYWLAPDGRQQFGPFASRAEAVADRDRYDEQAPAEGESLGEAESEIGIADWIDAETGAPAEGTSPPHLDTSE